LSRGGQESAGRFDPFQLFPRKSAMTESLVGGSAMPLSIRATAVVASAVIKAARQLLRDLERGQRIDAAVLRNAMEAAFGASDATGAWNWKTAYDACEAATVLFLRRYGAAMHGCRPLRRPETSARPRDGRTSHRTVRLQRHHAGPSARLWALWGDHRPEAAHVRADRRQWRRRSGKVLECYPVEREAA
jgi:hypothetical protein